MAKKNEQTHTTHGRSESEGHASGSSEGISMSHSTTTTTSANSRPLRTFRLKGVKASVFENRTEQGTFYKTSLQKVYRDGEERKTTTSLGRDDLPVARLLLGRAWEFILETEAGLTSQETQTTTHESQQRSQHESNSTQSGDTAFSVGRGRTRGGIHSTSES